jgi:hypothetical protein
MSTKPWTADERARILREHTEIQDQRKQALDSEDWSEGDVLMAKLDKLTAAYYGSLPRLVMAPCPFDGKPLIRSFDPVGLDGLWWHEDATPDEIPSCPHFCALGGAVSYQGLPPHAGNREIFPGPEIPFVYPRLLGLPGVVAVIGSLPMDNGYLAYPIAYFAERRPPGELLVAGWRRTHHEWHDQLGGFGSRYENDSWDFDLRPWLAQGKLRWTAPGSDRTKLAADPPEKCPYLDLPGKPEKVSLLRDEIDYLFPPDGTSISPYDD